MKLHGQSIRLFIIESLKKLKTAELSNWVGKVYIGGRKHSQVIQKLDELQCTTGIYLLLSNSNDETKMYIGEADDVATRIYQHHSNKDWWENFVIFTSKDSNLTKAHVRYLEKELYKLAKENLTTIQLDNATSPPGSNLPDYDIADMDIFLENMIFILNNLGIIDFTKVSTEESDSEVIEENIFYINLKGLNKDKQAKLTITDNGYKLLKGSYLEKEPTKCFANLSAYKKRNELIEANLIVEQGDIMISIDDIYFKSPSGASDVVKASGTNGKKEWKLSSGKTIDEFEAEEQ